MTDNENKPAAAPCIPVYLTKAEIEDTYKAISAAMNPSAGMFFARGWNVIMNKLRDAMSAAPAAPKASAVPEALVDDLAMLVRRLVRELEKANPGMDLAPQALDYLKRKGLQGSPLRAAPQAEEAPASARAKCEDGGECGVGGFCDDFHLQRDAAPERVQPSIDTPEFRELLGKVYKRTSFSFLTPNTETQTLIAHIDAKLTQARGKNTAQVKHLTHERDLARRAATEACARAEEAEAQLAAIRAGVEGLKRYDDFGHCMDQWAEGDFILRDDALALFGPADHCDICDDTGTAFGKRCECKGAAA